MRALILAGLQLSLGAGVAAGQHAEWGVSLEIGEVRFSGTSADTSAGGDGAFRPFRPATLGLRVERGGATLRVGLGVAYGSAAAALEGAEATVISRGSALKLIEVAPVVAWRLAARPGGAGLFVEAGPVLDHWSWTGSESRTRVGAAGAFRGELPLGPAVFALLRLGIGVTGSVFQPGELPPAFARRHSWRRSVAIGVKLRS